MGNNTWDNTLDPHPVARGSAFASFTTYQDISPTPLPSSYINELKLGTKVIIEAVGEFSTTATPTLQIGAIYGAVAGSAGGVAIGQSAQITTGSGAAAWPWHYKWEGLVTAVGSSGVIYGSGILDLGTSLSAMATNPCPITAAARSATIDTTTQKLWGMGATWGTSSASNSIRVDAFSVQILNQGKT